MTDSDLRDQIARLEADIEQLAEGLDRCRKAMRRGTSTSPAHIRLLAACQESRICSLTFVGSHGPPG